METKVPFFFYIDIYAEGVTNEKRDVLIDWFNQSTENNKLCRGSDTIANIHWGRFVGFVEYDSSKGNEQYLGFRQGDYEGDFWTRAKKITYKFWEKNIKDAEYNALTVQENSYISKETISVVKAKRNEIVYAELRSTAVESALKLQGDGSYESLQFVKGHNYIIHKNSACRWCSFGFALRGEKNVITVDSDEVPKSLINSAIRRKRVAKCSQTGLYSFRHNIVDAINENGRTVKVSRYHFGAMPRSNRDNKWFLNRVAATNHGYAQCEMTNDWLPSSEARKKPNAAYHSLDRKWNCPKSTMVTVGFEIEKEDREAHAIGYENLYNRTNWIKERDGSLDEEIGYELVSPVFNLFSNDLDKALKDEEISILVNGKYSEKCGGHINIASKVYTPIQLLHGLKGFLPLLYAIWNLRMDNRYCKPEKIHKYPGNRGALNVKEHVLEIRLASAVKSSKNLLWRRDLVRIMIENINKSEMEVLRMMLNSRSKLHKHLRKVYNAERFMQKCNMFVKLSGEWNDIRLDEINWDRINGAKAESTPVVEED